jgi:predicted permease
LLTTIIGALLPIVVVLLLGFFSGWHKDFTGDQATILNRMVMLYALPLLLFGSTVSISRSRLLENVPLALAVAAGMVGSFFVVLLAARFVFQRDLGTSALQALTIAGPAVPFVGVSVLGYVFGPANESFASGIMLFARRVSLNRTIALNAVARKLIVPAVFWGALVLLKLPPAAIREAVITLAIPTAAMAVILAVQFKTAEQEMASSLLFSTVLSIPTMGAFMFLIA